MPPSLGPPVTSNAAMMDGSCVYVLYATLSAHQNSLLLLFKFFSKVKGARSAGTQLQVTNVELMFQGTISNNGGRELEDNCLNHPIFQKDNCEARSTQFL